MKEKSCAELIGQELKDRENQLTEMMKVAEKEGEYSEIYELALGISHYKVTNLTLSWGGPSDELEIHHDNDGIGRIVYRYSDWFDTATAVVEKESPLWQYAEMMLEVVEA